MVSLPWPSVCRRRLHDHEAISDSRLGEDITRPNDVALDLSAQVSHLDAKVLLCVAVAAATPHLPEEVLMRQRASRLRRQRVASAVSSRAARRSSARTRACSSLVLNGFVT